MTDENVSSSKTEIKSSGQRSSLKFTSPISVRMIDSHMALYKRTVWCAIGNGLTTIFIGATLMCFAMYSSCYGDGHAILCSLAYHFFVAEAILSLSYINGWSTPMRYKHRKFTHVVLQLCGLVCAVVGTVIVLSSKGLSKSVHGVTGATLVVLTLLSTVVGPAALKGFHRAHVVHMGLGIPTFFISSACIISGLFTPGFKQWAGIHIVSLLLGFIMFYTALIVTATLMKCVKKI